MRATMGIQYKLIEWLYAISLSSIVKAKWGDSVVGTVQLANCPNSVRAKITA